MDGGETVKTETLTLLNAFLACTSALASVHVNAREDVP
jgi:hypothetical protein